jgi:Fe(3+) dicitrate transport protein
VPTWFRPVGRAGSTALASFLLSSGTMVAQVPDRTTADSALTLDPVVVIGQPDDLDEIPGSGEIVTRQELIRSRVLTTDEALRKVPGVIVRDEEGFGLRPNVGLRGLNPSRSSKVLLLEDGIPFVIAPYGAAESYYHPPVERFDRIEVLKGSGQILHGPQTIGGVINYITRPVPSEPTISVALTPGNREYFNGQARAGATWGRAGAMLEYTRKQGDGSRANVGSRLNDANLKAQLLIGATQTLTLRANYYGERSRVTYSGLTEAEFAADRYQNPFVNDSMLLDRWGASATHRIGLGRAVSLSTSAYGYTVSRDWWRQSSNSSQRPNDASDPRCGSLANLSTTCGNEGRLREYRVGGVEPRLRAEYRVGRVDARLEAGVRAHYETQDRLQLNGDSPNAREAGPSSDVNSGVREDNVRRNQAYSAFLQNRFEVGRVGVTPGLRLEHVRYQRLNSLVTPDRPAGVYGRTTLTQLIPGIGVTYAVGGTTVFGGVHRGFAPPRTEDVISNTTGGTVDLDAELSWNYELGARSTLGVFHADLTLFRLDFRNQIIASSLAGGTGSTLTSAGRTLHQGLELGTRLDAGPLLGTTHEVYLRGAYTFLPTARFAGERFAFIGTGGSDVAGKVYADQNADGSRARVDVSGNRLPYAPRHLFTGAAGYGSPSGFAAQLEVVFVGGQFADPVNTAVTVADGQQGPVPGYTVWNVALSYQIPRINNTVFLTLKNLFDRDYVADRTRGILPGMPRLVQAGFVQVF